MSLEAFKARFGASFVTSEAMRCQHAHTTTWIRSQLPDGIVFAQTTEEIQDAVRLAAAAGLAVVPFGAGTSLEGQVNAPQGGISIDLSQMNRVLSVRSEDLDCTIEPGVTRLQLNEYLRDSGLLFPIDPGADATLGGMASTRASGTNAVRYGTMRDAVVNLKVVLADGSVISTGNRARKSSAGYDLTRLFVGAEGTLGIISELTLRLSPRPEAVSAIVGSFPSVDAACQCVIATIQCGITPARIELMDTLQVEAVNAYSGTDLPVAPLLLIELHGSPAGVEETSQTIHELVEGFEGQVTGLSTRDEERNRLWQARHDSYWACKSLRPGCSLVATDVCVPISRLADCVTETQADIAQSRLVAPIVGHVGDGNFHVSILVDDSDADEVARVEAFTSRLAARALKHEGTCTGEHGIGQGKIAYLTEELGEAVDVMRSLKRALDPHNRMNPGKIFSM